MGREERDFGRIDVELVGAKTNVLTCWERRPCQPPTMKSYGFGFGSAMARAAPGCQRSATIKLSHTCVDIVCKHIDVLNIVGENRICLI